jgi:HAD superfamily hydrolase (TIGR01509 family)
MSSEAAIDAVIFDWDGTLMDSKSAILASYHEVTKELLGEPFPVEDSDVDHIIQLRAQEAFPIIAKGDPELTEKIAAGFHEAYAEHQQRTQPFDGTLETLRELKSRGIKIGIATSKARKRMNLDGERTGINDLVDFAITGDDVNAAKPAPEPVAKAIEGLGVEPGRALYVGDGPNDVLSGQGAGAITVGVSFGFHPAEMREANPDHVIDHPSELLELAAGAAAASPR